MHERKSLNLIPQFYSKVLNVLEIAFFFEPEIRNQPERRRAGPKSKIMPERGFLSGICLPTPSAEIMG
jgi:hypothetical protein